MLCSNHDEAEDLEDNNTNPALRLSSVTGFFQFKMKQLILPISLIFIICSCEPNGRFERIIVNQSSHDIWIKTDTEIYHTFIQDSIVIEKNSYAVVAKTSERHGVSGFSECGFPEGALTYGVLTSDTLHIQKNLNASANWTFSIIEEHFKGSGTCECRLLITDSDIK